MLNNKSALIKFESHYRQKVIIYTEVCSIQSSVGQNLADILWSVKEKTALKELFQSHR
jgi:hypothetical protein